MRKNSMVGVGDGPGWLVGAYFHFARAIRSHFFAQVTLGLKAFCLTWTFAQVTLAQGFLFRVGVNLIPFPRLHTA